MEKVFWSMIEDLFGNINKKLNCFCWENDNNIFLPDDSQWCRIRLMLSTKLFYLYNFFCIIYKRIQSKYDTLENQTKSSKPEE